MPVIFCIGRLRQEYLKFKARLTDFGSKMSWEAVVGEGGGWGMALTLHFLV